METEHDLHNPTVARILGREEEEHPMFFERDMLEYGERRAREAATAERERLFYWIRDDKNLDPIVDALTSRRECYPGGHCHHVSGYALAEALAAAIKKGE